MAAPGVTLEGREKHQRCCFCVPANGPWPACLAHWLLRPSQPIAYDIEAIRVCASFANRTEHAPLSGAWLVLTCKPSAQGVLVVLRRLPPSPHNHR